MTQSPAVDAARHFLSVVSEGTLPSHEVLAGALDRLAIAYHQTPASKPADIELEPPEQDGPELYRQIAARFPDYGLYPTADPLASVDQGPMMGDAIDDIADITRDLREVVWRCANLGVDDAHWYYRLNYFHWGRHMRELALYLHARQFG
jgi:hypothetical protein